LFSLPTGTLAFLFTDIAGSTQLWDTQHAAMKQAHARQADIIAAGVTAHNGHVVRDRGEGDSTFSVFAAPADAVAAACDIQRALLAEEWPTDAPLRVRASLHVGPAELREGDYNSTAVNRCARLRSLAAGGQTLVSQAVTLMTEGMLPQGVTLRSLGTHRLKDLERPEEIFQLCHAELPDDFPPLRSLNSLPTNLPQQLNRFIGREAEIRQLTALLHPHDQKSASSPTHLLTLIGTGGAGKTRLSLQIGAELLEEYADGVWLVELAALSEPALLPQTVAATMEIRGDRNRPVMETLLEHLKSRNLLLLLDNCEHLLDACARFAETLLRACPQVKILATSREALNIAGERVHRVASLSLPDVRQPFTADCVTQYEAPLLFMERATQVKESFVLTDEMAPTLALLCHRLDGIPLAIELAAVRMRSLSIPDIYNRLDQRFRLLTGGGRTALPRQQTLRALIDWSYDLLSGSERLLLARLSVFSGGWTLTRAEVVCADDRIEEWEVLDLLSGLVDKSLVLAEESQGAIRYRMLETISQYGAEKLRESGEETMLRERHRDCYLALAEEARANLNGPEQANLLETLEAEHNNLRQAMVFCLQEPGGPPTGLRIAGALSQFWSIRGHSAEARRRFDALLAHPEAQERTQARALALNGAGILAYNQGDYAAARTLIEESLSIRKELQDTVGVSRSLSNLGLIAREQGEYARAHALYEESMVGLRATGDKLGIAICLFNQGRNAHDRSDYALARSIHQEGLAIWKELGDKSGTALALNGLGIVVFDEGDYAFARSLYEETLEIQRELKDGLGISNCLNNLGTIASAEGDYALARSQFEESLAIKRELGDRQGSAIACNNLGDVACGEHDYLLARSLYEQSLAIRREIGDRKGIAGSLNSLANLARLEADPALSRSLYLESLAIQQEIGDKPGLIGFLEGIASLQLDFGSAAQATRLWAAAERLREEFRTPPIWRLQKEIAQDLARAQEILGEEAFWAARIEGAALSMEQALDLAQKLLESG